jgi:phosphoribosylformylglycinamidine cyclo-ligase
MKRASPPKQPLTYQASGVSLSRGYQWIRFLKTLKSTSSNQKFLKQGIGPFASASWIPKFFGKQPIVVTACDGIGTKLKFPLKSPKDLRVLGQDLVAMNVNDVSAVGAIPFLFLDYLACGRISTSRYRWFMEGIQQALNVCNTLLVGGETAEMPVCYEADEFDAAGFVVGFSTPRLLLDPKNRLQDGDVLIGLPSSGLHSNGYSLIHKAFTRAQLKRNQSALFKPTALYSPLMNHLLSRSFPLKGAAHITGGGFIENIGRILPPKHTAHLYRHSWEADPVFDWILKHLTLTQGEQYKIFNMGLGFVLVCAPSQASPLLTLCQRFFPSSVLMGEIRKGPSSKPVVIHE